MSLLSRLFGRSRAPAPAPEFSALLSPEQTLAVIGDVHGCADLLDRLLDTIAEHQPSQLVFVGDLVDRGEDSAVVLERVQGLQRDAGAVVLQGNHEEMLLDFLDDPVSSARRWLRFGGLQTLASFRIGAIGESSGEAKLIEARDALAEAIGQERLDWLRNLPTWYRSGNVGVVHAAADPALPIETQPRQALLWGHPEFRKMPRNDGLWVVHGHTISDEVAAQDGRIGVDTGAYATGRLSAALIGAERLDVVTATR